MALSRTIVIAGAGIGGLTAALALAARGFRIVVLEKAERLEEVGAGLQLSPNASRVLVGLGLTERLKLRAVVPEAVSIMSARAGGELLRMPLGEAASVRAGAPYWVVHRADLQSALAGAVSDHPDIDLKLGATFEDVAPHAKGLTVVHRSGTIRRSDLASALIGADGIWSTVRQHLFPEVQPRFSGLIAWRGTLDATQLPKDYTARRVQLWMGPNAHLVAYPIAGGRQINVVAVLPGTWNRPGWSTPGDPREVMDAFAAPRWPSQARMMLAAVDGWRKWALFGVPDGCPWSKGPVALLGDAVHAMPAVRRARRRHGDRGCRRAGTASEPRDRREHGRHRRSAEAIWPRTPGARATGAADRTAAGPHLSFQRTARDCARCCDPGARPGAHAGAAGLDLRLAPLMRSAAGAALQRTAFPDFGAGLAAAAGAAAGAGSGGVSRHLLRRQASSASCA
ncbi:2-polyprenyl-6-methoxyphenol hydroxylase-like FAD-dependent oxidoreductase [Bradyrhizobium diazoefficiens]